jgi:hypothetical protein
VGYRADLLNLRTTHKLKLPHPTEGGADQAAAAQRQKEKHTTHKPKTWKDYHELLLTYQHQDWMLEE